MMNNPESSKLKLSGRHPVVGYELSRRPNLLRLCKMPQFQGLGRADPLALSQ